MYRILTASKDNYITNKIINNSFRATDANVGNAATLDIFKLYAESTTGSDTSPIEVSRALVKFNLNKIRSLTGSILDINHSSFKCTLKLFDVYGGQTTPSNFNIIVFPLSKSFDEGVGRDIVSFSDVDSSNYVTASISGNTIVAWEVTGANRQGLLHSSDIDIISSGNLNDGNSVVNLWKNQTFAVGDEDLSVDVTSIISGTLAGMIPDAGFRISLSGSEETDSKTRFVKRFGSTQHSNFSKRPQLIIKYDDSIQDHHKSLYFNLSSSLFLNNFHRGVESNILSGSGATEITGSNSLILTLRSGTVSRSTFFEKIITASQHKIGQNFITGVYSASFAVSEYVTASLFNEMKNAGSATFTEIWGSLDGSVGYITSSLTINQVNRSSFNNQAKRLIVSVTNMSPEYCIDDKVRFRAFVEDVDRVIIFKKLPVETVSQIFTSMYYRIRDYESGEVVIPFDTSSNSTLCSTDSSGMYFDIYMDSLPKGRTFTIDFLIKDRGLDQVFTDVAAKFRVA
tara:strand:- start:1863 stop:3398 length:1536 start_codon:yes stop_codon:yes gene_type:complete